MTKFGQLRRLETLLTPELNKEKEINGISHPKKKFVVKS